MVAMIEIENVVTNYEGDQKLVNMSIVGGHADMHVGGVCWNIQTKIR